MTRTSVLTQRIAVFCTAGLLVATAACGSDSGGGLSDDQQYIADDVVSTFEEFGLDIDRDCVEEIAAQMPDDDARLYVESEGEADGFSAEADALGAQIDSCTDEDLSLEE